MLICKKCGKEIKPKDRKFYSRQRGMTGWYHWNCYRVQVHDANEFGEREILYTGATQSMLQPMGSTEGMNSIFESVNHG